MDLPFRCPYNPPWRVGLAILLASAGCGALAWLCPSFLWCAACGASLLSLATVLVVRRLLLPRFLVLEQDSLLLPTGFLRLRCIRVFYAEIEAAEECGVCLKLLVAGRVLEMLSSFFPDEPTYVAVRDFLCARVHQETPPLPSERGRYAFWLTWDGDGMIYNSNGEPLWEVRTTAPFERPRYGYWLRRLPDFVVSDPAQREWVRVRRVRRWPRARFEMIQNGATVCVLRPRGLLPASRYTLDFADGARWTFCMPPFTVRFHGESRAGERIAVLLDHHIRWFVMIDESADHPLLVAALAFVHRERLRCV